MGSRLGYESKAAFGFDDITMGWQGAGGPSLRNQTLGGIATKDIYLGLFGLTPRSSNFTTFNSPIPGYIQNLRNQSFIPSTSWGYTAGNQYRFNRVLGSLTLVGYDRSRFVANDVSFSFNEEDIRDLTVQIDAITVSSKNGEKALLPNTIPAFLDLSLPYVWLPMEACVLFEKAFNLTWDDTTGLYPLSGSQHDALLAESANITFTLGNLTEGVALNITLSYSPFDLTVQPPLVSNTTRYLPLKRATNYTQYTLGRVFFQEAYVYADYDRLKFSVSQCRWAADSQQDIVPILAPLEKAIDNGTFNDTGNSDNKSKATTSIAAIVGGIVGAIAILAAIAAFTFFRFKRRRDAEAAKASQLPPSQPETDPNNSFTFFNPELDGSLSTSRLELDAHKEQWSYEAASRPVQLYEMPSEDVAAEMRGEGQMSELRGEG
ncbi:hypothetical protein HYALB_00010552 [Hymenoscyphus albidus]|uniref:Peptidase A1 domain-containing protein n=1 Tax=Hymenoscyphus albidus TaxID=595503 RepID=A0A9N9LN12_9HELO|nr:hypothetical protein HYALB_00010552 [Hymenoscyphus albidus]